VSATDGATATASWAATGCPAGASPVYERRDRTTTNGSSAGWSSWTTWDAATSAPVAMSQGAKLDVQTIARCVSPYTYDVAPAGVQPTTQTNGPASPVGSLTGWVRPIQAPAGPTTIWHDAGGTSQPVDNRFLWSGVACPANTWPQYSRALNGSWYGDWISGATVQDAAVVWGTTYTPVVQARCASSYTQSDDSPPVTGQAWTTNVPRATGVWNDASPSSVYTEQNLWVSVGGGNCPAGTYAIYWSTDGAGHTYPGSFGDRWKDPGVKSYTSRAYCQGPNNRGPDSDPATASVTVTTPPAPNWGSASPTPSAMFASCTTNDIQEDGFWGEVANATSYTATSYIEITGIWYSAPASVGYAAGQWQSYSDFAGRGNGFQVQAGYVDVTANGPGGSTTHRITASFSTC
jgi:hypothetical protein